MEPLSLFLPVFNEEELLVCNTEKLMAFLAGLDVAYEIIIGSNGSTDRTYKRGAELQKRFPQVRFFHRPKKGPGGAFKQAIELMRYDRLICLDMDLSSALEFIPESSRLLGEYDIVIGSKRMGIERRSAWRRQGSRLFVACCRRLLKLPYDDYSMGAKAYRKPVLVQYATLIDQQTAYTQNIIYAAFRGGFRIIQIPVLCADFRLSRFNLAKEAVYRFAWLLRLWVLRG